MIGKTILNRYHVQDFLGRGGMAEVYKVWDQERTSSLAMKLLLEDLAVDRVFIRRFKREAANLKKLDHPNIVRYYGLEQDGPLAFMLLDFIDGKTLKRIIFDAKGPMTFGAVLYVMQGLTSALSYAHTRGMVHCDIKPGNVMISYNGQLLLTDFGIARMTDAATATMVGAGTPAYMAPEQILGQDPVPQTDIYALGILLYEMLTGGERPFTGDKATTGSVSEKVRWEQINQAPPSPRKWNPEIPPEVEAIVMRCLAKDPGDRYLSALELWNDLISTAERRGIGEIIPVVVKQTEPERRRIQQPAPSRRATSGAAQPKNRAGLFAGLAAAAVVVLIAIIAVFNRGPAPVTYYEPPPDQPAIEEPDENPIGEEPDVPLTDTPELPTDSPLPTDTRAPVEDGTGGGPTPDPRTATVNALLTQAALAQTQAVQKPPTSTPKPAKPMFTAGTDLTCRNGPGTNEEQHWQLTPGQTVPALAKYSSNNWIVVAIDDSGTRTKCCWVNSDYGNLNVSLSSLLEISYLPDRINCDLRN